MVTISSFFNDPTTVTILCMLLGLVAANMITKGFLRALLMVKLFKRGNILVCCTHNLEDYYIPGKWDAGALEFMTRKRADNPKPKRILSIQEDLFKYAKYRSWGVDVIMFDDVKNSIYIRKNNSYESVGGYNAEAMAEKLDTALKKPPEDEVGLMPMKQFMIIMIVAVVALGIFLYINYQQGKTLDAHMKLLFDAMSAAKNLTGG